MLNDNQPGGVDRVGHSSVQAWSAGPLFPAIIAVVERYPEQAGTVCTQVGGCSFCDGPSVSYELTLDSRSEEYATRDDAERVAAGLLADPVSRARWNGDLGAGLADHDDYAVAR